MRRTGFRLAALPLALFGLLGGGVMLAVEVNSPVAPQAPDFAHLTLGSGYGMNYGGIGLSFEFNPRLPRKLGTGIHRFMSLALGVGYFPEGGLAYSFGIHVYPLGRGLFLQPRLGLQYGVVAVVADGWDDDERRAEGAAFGAGFLLRWARRIFVDADIHFIVPVEWEMDDLQGGRLRFSAGLRYRL
ncbi:MAG: hypothetical protein JXO51_09665 [Candidatus Aminicenantes bacterium]|nr:hypothetical protein [Candidatus Aminicenantes bacterium]